MRGFDITKGELVKTNFKTLYVPRLFADRADGAWEFTDMYYCESQAMEVIRGTFAKMSPTPLCTLLGRRRRYATFPARITEEDRGRKEGDLGREEEPRRVHVCGADPPPREVCDRMKKLLPFSLSLPLTLLSSTLSPLSPSVPPAVLSSCGAPPALSRDLAREAPSSACSWPGASQSLARSVGRLDGAETESKTD